MMSCDVRTYLRYRKITLRPEQPLFEDPAGSESDAEDEENNGTLVR